MVRKEPRNLTPWFFIIHIAVIYLTLTVTYINLIIWRFLLIRGINMKNITFFDIEIEPNKKEILDIGGIMGDGNSFHSDKWGRTRIVTRSK